MPYTEELSSSDLHLWKKLLSMAEYRQPMPIREMLLLPFSGRTGCFYLCPRCHISLERDFMAFCDRCGQRLDWRDYKNAKALYPEKGSSQPEQKTG